jgi:hypothetical protein
MRLTSKLQRPRARGTISFSDKGPAAWQAGVMVYQIGSALGRAHQPNPLKKSG